MTLIYSVTMRGKLNLVYLKNIFNVSDLVKCKHIM